MIDILGDWDGLKPANEDLLLTRGGTLVMKGAEVKYSHKDKGILGYANVDDVLKAAQDTAPP